ncbi:rubrerythrin family protein [bacterium SCGC AG-212-C10]|nr:rubrerythrin family protein [bacterium SCGC AG-212-C10]
MSADDIKRYHSNLRDEVDGAALYHFLADAEKDPNLRTIFQRLAASEERHMALWRTKLEEAGETVPEYGPSARVRFLGWTARRLGTAAVTPIVGRMERQAYTMYDDQPEAVEHGLPRDERSHARLFNELGRNRQRDVNIARIEGRHRGATSGNALRAAVLGSNDGLVSNLCLVMGVAGADPGRSVVILTGVAGLIAGSLSMALGEWVSVRSSAEAFEKQMAIEADELAVMPEEEREELALIYQSKGISRDDANELAARIIANKDTALDTLAREELGMAPEEVGNPWVAAGTSFLTFAIGAILPILPWLVAGGWLAVAGSLLFSSLGLFAVGAATSLFTGRSLAFAGGRMLLIGLAAAAITFGIGTLIGVNTSV